MTRFFVSSNQISGSDVILDNDDAHHIKTVLRLKAGNQISILDGSGYEYDVILTEVGKSHSKGRITNKTELHTESPIRITVAQALPKISDKLEQVLQRGTEAGAAGFYIYTCNRSQSQVSADRQDKRILRWQKIIKTACEQSHRAEVPELKADYSFNDIVGLSQQFNLTLFAYEDERDILLHHIIDNITKRPLRIMIIIGPEGGFDTDEVETAKKAGIKSISLGPRILRTETAALIMIAQLLYALDR